MTTQDSSERRYSDRELMQRAIELSKQCISEPGKYSPKVGAVIADNGKIIGESFRTETGDHAEFTLLEQHKNEQFSGTTLYVTLEPCTERPNPKKIPCAHRIIERRIRKVFIGVLDPNSDIRGLGEIQLRKAGIQVARFDSDLQNVIDELNCDFYRAQLDRLKADELAHDKERNILLNFYPPSDLNDFARANNEVWITGYNLRSRK